MEIRNDDEHYREHPVVDERWVRQRCARRFRLLSQLVLNKLRCAPRAMPSTQPVDRFPRGCIGQYFSMLEATLATASIVLAFGLHAPSVQCR